MNFTFAVSAHQNDSFLSAFRAMTRWCAQFHHNGSLARSTSLIFRESVLLVYRISQLPLSERVRIMNNIAPEEGEIALCDVLRADS